MALSSTPARDRATHGRSCRRAATLLAGLLAGALALGCGDSSSGAAAEPPYSGLLVTLDTTRADALSPYGNRPQVTPGLQQLAAESLLFERAHTVTPLTLPSHASMLTGLYPPRHTVRDNGLWAVPSTADTLAERARANGIQTAAFLSAVVLDESFGLAQGFETYVTPSSAGQSKTTYVSERSAQEVVDDAIRWFEEDWNGERFFLWVHLFDPHGPHEPPPAFRGKEYGTNPYHGEVAYADRELSRLFDYMRERGLLDETFLAVAADHGEAFGEKGIWSHGQYIYQPTMRVPMILRDPAGHRAGKRTRETVSVVDLFPTLSEAMGVPVSDTVDGLSLFRREVPEGRGVYFEAYNGFLSFGWSPLAGWVQGDRKYLHSSEPELYDLGMDATESRNLYSVRQEEAQEYQRAIDGVFQRPALERDTAELDPSLQAEISDLGYVTMGATAADLPHPLEPSDLPSPGSMIETHRKTLEGLTANNQGRFPEAEQLFLEALETTPENHMARNMLGFVLMQQRRHAEAIPHIRKVLDEGPQWPDTYSNLGICLAVTEQWEESEVAFRKAIALDPRHVGSHLGLSRLMQRLNRPEEAAEFEARYAELKGGS